MRPIVHYPFGRPEPGMDVLWRCVDKRYAYVVDAERDEWGVTDPRLEMVWYEVRRRTPQGAWIDDPTEASTLRFVRLTARKRFATETEREAVESLLARRVRQESIYAARAKSAAAVVRLARAALEHAFPDQILAAAG